MGMGMGMYVGNDNDDEYSWTFILWFMVFVMSLTKFYVTIRTCFSTLS